MKQRFISILKPICLGMALFGLVSCTKTKVENWKIPDEFQAWCRYKEGSYWVYRNEKTQQLDCTYVTRFTSGAYPHYDSDVIRYYYDWENSEMKGYILTGISVEASGVNEASMNYGQFYFSTSLLANPIFRKAWYGGGSNQGVVAVYPTEDVNGNAFSNVYHCRVEWQLWDGDSVIVDGHLVKNIGMVKYKKRIDQADTTWTLLRWHVIQ